MSVSGQGTTFNLPNYTGDLYQVAPSDVPFLSAIGGLSGGRSTNATTFEWQTEGLEASSANNSKVEGAAAPAASEVARTNVTNVVEIHQEAVEVSYTKQAATGQHSGANIEGSNPVVDELTHQIQLKLRKVAIDVEQSFLNGTKVSPANNSTARATQGVLGAITTNVFAQTGTGGVVLTADILRAALANMYKNGAPLSQESTVIIASPSQRLALTAAYSTATLNQPTMTRNIGGVAIDTIVTEFGTLGVMTDRYMPATSLGIVDLSVCQPVWLNIPGKGQLFVEPLSKVGASDKYQLYGEVGLQYGPEQYHGIITNLKDPLAAS